MFADTSSTTTLPSGRELTEAEKVRQISQRDDFLFYAVVLAGILLACGVVFYFLDRWRKASPKGESDREDSLTLSSFREMYEDGEITESEYHRLRDKMAAKMKSNLGVKPTMPPNKPPEPPVPPDAAPHNPPPPDPPDGPAK